MSPKWKIYTLLGLVFLGIFAKPTWALVSREGVTPMYQYFSAGAGQFGLTVATATHLTPPAPKNTNVIAQICVETSGVRYRDDGTAPTASVGIPVIATSTTPNCFQYAGPLNAIQFIAISGSPTLDVSYYYAN